MVNVKCLHYTPRLQRAVCTVFISVNKQIYLACEVIHTWQLFCNCFRSDSKDNIDCLSNLHTPCVFQAPEVPTAASTVTWALSSALCSPLNTTSTPSTKTESTPNLTLEDKVSWDGRLRTIQTWVIYLMCGNMYDSESKKCIPESKGSRHSVWDRFSQMI